MTTNVEWSAGSEGVRQTVWIEDDRSLVIMLTSEGVVMDLVKDGEVIGSEWATYIDIAEGLYER